MPASAPTPDSDRHDTPRHVGVSRQQSWGSTAKLLHWLIALLILLQFPLGWIAAAWHLSPTKLDLFVWHKSLGMLILLLALVRLAWRLTHPAPPHADGMTPWETAAARFTHALLYVLMIALPLAGWLVDSAAGIPFKIFWVMPRPALVGADKSLQDLASVLHLGLGVALTLLMALHIAAALRHHLIKQDDVLTRMLPTWRLRP